MTYCLYVVITLHDEFYFVYHFLSMPVLHSHFRLSLSQQLTFHGVIQCVSKVPAL
jgi:hypothetical protein